MCASFSAVMNFEFNMIICILYACHANVLCDNDRLSECVSVFLRNVHYPGEYRMHVSMFQ